MSTHKEEERGEHPQIVKIAEASLTEGETGFIRTRAEWKDVTQIGSSSPKGERRGTSATTEKGSPIKDARGESTRRSQWQIPK